MRKISRDQIHGFLRSLSEIKTNTPILGHDGKKRFVKIEADKSLGIYEVTKEVHRTEIVESVKVATCEEWGKHENKKATK